MKINWEKWGLDFFQSLGRHVGTAGMTWLGLGVKDGTIEWNNLWLALLTGAILPTIFTFIQQPVPKDDETKTAPATKAAQVADGKDTTQ